MGRETQHIAVEDGPCGRGMTQRRPMFCIPV